MTPLGWENPLRLAEDLATVDVLSGGRVHPGVSVGAPMHFDDVKAALYPDTADQEDFTYKRVTRLLNFISGEPAATFSGTEGFEEFSDRVQPHSPGLRSRVWYGAASMTSSRWAGRADLNLLSSSIVSTDGIDGPVDFASVQSAQIRAYRQAHPAGANARVSQGLVVIPTDSASATQKEKYAAYVAARTPRTRKPFGPRNFLVSPDIIGTAEQIADQLYAHAAFREVTEVAFALPFSFAREDYAQILTDIATRLGPALGWQPAAPGRPGPLGAEGRGANLSK